jgi:hypothetical protein
MDPLILALATRTAKVNVHMLFQLFKEIRDCGGSVSVDWKDAEGPLTYIFKLTPHRDICFQDGDRWVAAGQWAELICNTYPHDMNGGCPAHIQMGLEAP